ncbi:hypothetical protein [Flammeovirga aprica]|uniref:DUF4595 domain-containing protein n=1 Tax=Flammeovirga aprica JL-4 TaxID=694437 RepID=A0A7X9RWF6_9BACT|nr:hypothetical protein [Flammeovirga aprica]NME69991.1 hypothetical protein [Flammeovirga aprica JL-4]
MKHLSYLASKLLIITFLASVFYSCGSESEILPDDPNIKDDNEEVVDPNELNDEDIVISENEIFNQVQFQKSFEQSFELREQFAFNYKHTVKDGKITNSAQNKKLHGKFGENLVNYNHSYDENGVIISSEKSDVENEDFLLTLYYTYDEVGYIKSITRKIDGVFRDRHVHEYNEKGQLVSVKFHHTEGLEDAAEVYNLKYDDQNNIIEYKMVSNFNGNERTEIITYEYINNLIYKQNKEDQTTTYNFDNENRLTSVIIDNHDSESDYEYRYSYDNTVMLYSSYFKGQISLTEEYHNVFANEVARILFTYNDDKTALEYAKKFIHGENNKTKYIELYGGDPENLVLEGKTEIISYVVGTSAVEEEKIYSKEDTLLYIINYEYDKDNINKKISTEVTNAEGNPLELSDITEEWVLLLIKY